MTQDEVFLIQIRDCFYAGYTVPQFCMDMGFKKPLFVADDSGKLLFLREIHIQFCYDKNYETVIQPTFASSFAPITVTDSLSVNFVTEKPEIKYLPDLQLESYDKIIALTTKNFLENISGVMYLHELRNRFAIRAYAEIPLLNFLQKNPGVKMFVPDFPCLRENENNTEREKQLLAERGLDKLFKIREQIEANPDRHVETPYDFLGYDNAKTYEVLEVVKSKINPDGSNSLEERHGQFLNIRDGRRVTAYQPENYRNKIYFFGNCVYFGFGVPDDKTVESRLQKLLNENNFPYRVENFAYPFSNKQQNIFYNLNNIHPEPGDIIFVNVQQIATNAIPFFDTCKFFLRPHNYGEVFADNGHINELGHKALAEKIFDFLVKNVFFQNVEFKYPPPPPPRTPVRRSEKCSLRRDKLFAQSGTGRVQKETAREKNFRRRNRHEL